MFDNLIKQLTPDRQKETGDRNGLYRGRVGSGRMTLCRSLGAASLVLACACAFAKPLSQAVEYRIKAAFVFNFAQFVEWPSNAFASERAPIIIGIIGDDPFGSALDETVKGELVGNRKLEIKRGITEAELRTCHILFISASEKSRVDAILAKLKGAPVLTISEAEGFAQRGGMINFVLEDQSVRFELNPDAVAASGLNVSSKMKHLARIVTPDGKKPENR